MESSSSAWEGAKGVDGDSDQTKDQARGQGWRGSLSTSPPSNRARSWLKRDSSAATRRGLQLIGARWAVRQGMGDRQGARHQDMLGPEGGAPGPDGCGTGQQGATSAQRTYRGARLAEYAAGCRRRRPRNPRRLPRRKLLIGLVQAGPGQPARRRPWRRQPG